MPESRDEAVAETKAPPASPPDAHVVEIRASEADAILGSASFETADAHSARRLPHFECLLRYGPRAALVAGLVGFAGVAGAYFSGAQFPFPAATPHPASIGGPQSSGESTEILRTVRQMAEEIRALKARIEALHAVQSLSAKEAAALEGVKARLDAVKAETGAETAELAGKVDRLQREFTTKLAQVNERFDRKDQRLGVVAHKQTKVHRGDAFDPSENPGAPGAPRPLGSLAPAANGPVQSF
jgi:hypothetical protein